MKVVLAFLLATALGASATSTESSEVPGGKHPNLRATLPLRADDDFSRKLIRMTGSFTEDEWINEHCHAKPIIDDCKCILNGNSPTKIKYHSNNIYFSVHAVKKAVHMWGWVSYDGVNEKQNFCGVKGNRDLHVPEGETRYCEAYFPNGDPHHFEVYVDTYGQSNAKYHLSAMTMKNWNDFEYYTYPPDRGCSSRMLKKEECQKCPWIEFDACTSNPGYCKNGGTCYDSGGNPMCSCPYPYTGSRCTKVPPPSDPCDSNPGYCENGGTCIDAGGNPMCICPYPYTGSRCQKVDGGPGRKYDCEEGHVCRTNNGGSGNNNEDFKRIKDISREKCAEKCEDNDDCGGYEYRWEKNVCELWFNVGTSEKNPSGNPSVCCMKTNPKQPSGGMGDDFECYENHLCRNSRGDRGSDGDEYDIIKPISRSECEKKCSKKSSCKGLEWRSSKLACEIWGSDLADSVHEPGGDPSVCCFKN